MSRIDVHCKSGTVITCRLVQVPEDDEIEGMVDEEGNNTSADNNTSIDIKKKTPINIQGTRIRRIIRRKCTLETLRKILEQPPKLPEITTSIITSPDDSNDLHSVPKDLRKGQQKNTFSNLSKAQQKFLKEQQKHYEKRARRDERMRQNVGKAILQGGLEGVEGMDITSLSLSASLSFPTAMSEDGGNPTSTAYRTQLEIQDKIEIADMGLAILMGESQRLERIMQSMKDTEESKTDKDDDDDIQSKQSSCVDDTDRSMSTYQSTDDEGSDDEDDDIKLALLMQGCLVEYSFPYEQHDELEKALMGDVSSSSDSEADDYTLSKKTPRQRRGRGRSPPRDGFISKHKDDVISPIVAIPTNGKGCVVIR